MISTKQTTETAITIEGPVGKLELMVNEAENAESRVWAIVCHPHPLFGGTMHNKIVTTLAKAFHGLGANTVRFNFRGVMRSDGVFDHGHGELDDLLAVIQWVRDLNPRQEIWLGGFSFGAYIAAKAASEVDAKKLVTIAPPVVNFPMKDLPPIHCQWVLAQGERDDVVAPAAVFEWAEKRDPQPVILRFKDAGHYFHGLLSELRQRVSEALVSS